MAGEGLAPVRQAHRRHARVALLALVAALAGCGGGGGLSDADQLFVVTADGRHRRQLTDGDAAHVSPSWSPDGRRLAFAATRCGSISFRVADADGEDASTLLRRRTCIGDVGVAWSPRGRTIALLTRFEDPGSAVTIDVVAPDGSHPRRLARFGTSIVAPAGPVWSPDGNELAYSGKSGGDSLDVIVVDRDRHRRRLTSGPDDAFDPRWSPHGDSVLFVQVVGRAVLGLAIVQAGGGRRRALPGRWADVEADWSPDGRALAVVGVRSGRASRYGLYRLDVPSGSVVELAHDPAARRPAWSPDGRRIAFATEDGRVATVAPSGGRVETLVDLGDAQIGDLAWSPDGSRLVFSAAKPPPED